MYQISCQAVMIEVPIMDLIQSTAPVLHQMTDPAPTIGSLVGGCVSEGMIAMANRIVGPSAFVRFTGTTNSPRRALASSGTGSGVFAQGPSTNCAGGWSTVVRGELDSELEHAPLARTTAKARTVN
ncbi:hypothetical protein R1CP_21115 [Rhodococcus opacus]|uniref:Uncharacterized protein n=2 Tax=Rhodococcus opacus TaxID=37919 RepID=A0A1B1K8K2_RHOOP|nr:hypothetical protein R1CP_21115 [Rhodococcus opacus]GLK41381.1 hypothetical protein GCM10017611_82570 [Rhodococcus wratislaviensis]